MEPFQEFLTINHNKEADLGQNLENRPTWYLYFCVLTADLLFILYGYFITWTSSYIPKLQSNNTEVNPLGDPITTLQVSLLASLPSASSALTTVLMAKVSDQLGRRKTMKYVSIGVVCCFIVLALARSIYLYYISLFICGIMCGGGFVSVVVYNSEIADDQNRGKIGCTMGFSVSTGILLGYVLGSITSFKMFILICALPAFLHVIFSMYIVESPIFMASNGHKYATTKIIKKLTGIRKDSYLELEYKKISRIVEDTKGYQRNFLHIFKNCVARKGLFMCLQTYFFQQFSGITAVLAFASPICTEAGASFSGDTVAIFIGLVTLFTNVLAASFVNKLGRKTLLLASSFLCACSMLFLGVYFYLQKLDYPITQTIRWFPIICILFYIFAHGIGLGPIPTSMIAEFFPNDLRAAGTGILFTVDIAMSTFIAFSFPLITEAFGRYTCMWTFSFFSTVGFISMFFNLFETKGKNFLEIQELLINHKIFKLKPRKLDNASS